MAAAVPFSGDCSRPGRTEAPAVVRIPVRISRRRASGIARTSPSRQTAHEVRSTRNRAQLHDGRVDLLVPETGVSRDMPAVPAQRLRYSERSERPSSRPMRLQLMRTRSDAFAHVRSGSTPRFPLAAHRLSQVMGKMMGNPLPHHLTAERVEPQHSWGFGWERTTRFEPATLTLAKRLWNSSG